MKNEDTNVNPNSLTPPAEQPAGGHENCQERLIDFYHALVFSAPSPEFLGSPDCFSGNRKAVETASALREIRRALEMSNGGDFSYKITSRGFLAGLMKGLQSKLNNLSWTARRIAGGDMEQRLDFMGGISEAFNWMTEQLSATLKELREEEERWKLAMLCSNDGIWEVSLNSEKAPYYSSRIFEMLGLSPENAPSIEDWPKFFHSDDHELLALYQRFVSWNNPPNSYALDHKLLCADGAYHWFLSRGMVLRDPVSAKPLRLIGVISNIQDRKEREENFSFRATHDVLTNLPNRLLFDEHMKNGIAVGKRSESHLAVVMVDLDKFKEINDTLGHHTGDLVLTEVAARMQKSLRESDMVSRFGGDEFTMILAFGKDEWHAVAKVLERTMTALTKPILIGEKEIKVTASFGVSVYPNNGESPRVLMERADEAMYHAKALGRNTCVFWQRGKRFTEFKFPRQ